jgi:hypothetical protein
VFLSGKEIKRTEHFVGQRISELINPSANGADRNELALMVSYARLGVAYIHNLVLIWREHLLTLGERGQGRDLSMNASNV